MEMLLPINNTLAGLGCAGVGLVCTKRTNYTYTRNGYEYYIMLKKKSERATNRLAWKLELDGFGLHSFCLGLLSLFSLFVI
jgi:hypothetical protein